MCQNEMIMRFAGQSKQMSFVDVHTFVLLLFTLVLLEGPVCTSVTVAAFLDEKHNMYQLLLILSKSELLGTVVPSVPPSLYIY